MSLFHNNCLMTSSQSTAGDDAYQIEKSLRFNSADSAYLSTTAKAGNRRTWTWSGWVKRSRDATQERFFLATDGNTHPSTQLMLDTTGELWAYNYDGSSYNFQLVTNAKFRDLSAWYHFVVAVDTTESIASERVKLYVNGKRITSLSTATYPSQNYETYINDSGKKIQLSDVSSFPNPFNGYLADVQFIDGLALSPAAFGSFDSTGVWNPKAFALPAPNNGTTWSSSTSTPDSGAAADFFDGDTSDSAYWTTVNTDHTITTGTFTINNSLRIYGNFNPDNTKFKINDVYTPLITTNIGSAWNVIDLSNHTLPLEVTSLKQHFASASGISLSAIEVDGVILVDGKTDKTYAEEKAANPNNGPAWENYLTISSGGWDNISGAQYAFGPNGTAWTANSGATITFTPPGGLAYSSKVEVMTASFGDQNFAINGGSATTVSESSSTWTTIATGSGTINTMTVVSTGGSSDASIHRIAIDGIDLLPGGVNAQNGGNSFHLKFNDTSLNRYLGKDTLNGKIADANGALPIYNTTDLYGDVKGSGNRTDSDSSNLKLAIAGDAFTDSSGNSVNVSASGAVVSTNQSRFYGSSIFFNGSSNHITTAGSLWSANGNQTFECWIWADNINSSNGHVLFDTGGSGQLLIQENSNVKRITFHPSDSNYSRSEDTIPEDQWVHIAFTQTSNTRTIFINGKKVTAYAATAGNAQTAAWNNPTGTFRIGHESANSRDYFDGYMQDIRIYDKVKYTSNFTPPTRNDFTVNNLSASADVQPTKQFHTVIYNGGGGDSSILGLSFKPDLVMIKCRSHGKWPPIADVVTGAGKFLHPNGNDAQGTSNHIKSFDSNGFTVTDEDTGTSNESGMQYVAWCWKAGGTATSNSDGSITTSISVNPNNTLSIIKYTGTGSNATIGHGLNKAPKMFIIKSLSDADDWYVYHYEAGANKYLWWNKYDGVQTSTSIWQNDHPSNSVIKIGTDDGVNESGDDYICYAFAEQEGLCAIGKYTGNGSNSGPTVNVGFKPAWITTKNSESDGGSPTWLMVDSVRGTDKRLWNNFGGNNGDTESTQASYTFSNTGFTITDDGAHFNGNNKEYYYLTFAQDASSGIYGDENIDSLVDTPTNYGTESSPATGEEVRGNYATLNPLKTGSGITLAQGNLYGSSSANSWKNSQSTIGMNSGKWYVEFGPGLNQDSNNNICAPSVCLSTHVATTNISGAGTTNLWYNGALDMNGSQTGSWASTYGMTEVIGCALDADTGKVWWSINGTWQASGNPATGANPAGTLTNTNNESFVFAANLHGSGYVHMNFGARAFKYTAPSGFKCLCTQNLPDTFSGDQLNKPSSYFDVITYKGTGASKTFSGLGFGPDMIWTKQRSSTGEPRIQDIVRGTNSQIRTNSNAGELTETNNVTAFNSDGYTIGVNGDINSSSHTHVAWLWDAGTSAATASTDGSITPSGQWVNATAGFSISKFTGTGADATIGHGLGAKPEFMIFKELTNPSNDAWSVYHKDLTNIEKWLALNTTDAEQTYADEWNETHPTNTVVHIGAGGRKNESGNTNVMYCWAPIAGYSAFGSYGGNSSTDGTFIYTGFAVKYLLIKRTDSTSPWTIFDSARGENENNVVLEANADSAEATPTNRQVDLLSNGFKNRATSGNTNATGGTYVYAAFAELPQKTARAM